MCYVAIVFYKKLTNKIRIYETYRNLEFEKGSRDHNKSKETNSYTVASLATGTS